MSWKDVSAAVPHGLGPEKGCPGAQGTERGRMVEGERAKKRGGGGWMSFEGLEAEQGEEQGWMVSWLTRRGSDQVGKGERGDAPQVKNRGRRDGA
eukprot:30629-Chlamydomonas_euryale.AAC.1